MVFNVDDDCTKCVTTDPTTSIIAMTNTPARKNAAGSWPP